MDKKKINQIVAVFFIVLFMIFGVVSIFNLGIDEEFEELLFENDVQTIFKDPVIKRAEPYLNKIDFNDVELRAYANSIIRDEFCWDKECELNAIYRYVVENFNYISDPEGDELIQTPQETIQIMGGDCEDLSILLASLLDNVGIKTYLVLTEDHAYCLAYDIDKNNLWDYIESSLIEQIEEEWGEDIRQTFSQTFSLGGQHNWWYGGDGSTLDENFEYMNISYSVDSDKPLDIYVVPSPDDFDSLNSGKTFTHYPSCEKDNILSIDDSCNYLDSFGGIILANNNWQTTTVSVEIEFYFRPSFYEIFSDTSITSYEIDNVDCIVLEPTSGKYGYVGYDANLSGEKIAIDPVSLDYVYLE